MLISCNWLVYVWSVTHAHIVDTSLGYYINPLMNVVLGVFVLRERLNRAQWIAVALAAIAVAYLTVLAGRPPWIACTLAVSFSLYGLLRTMLTEPFVPDHATGPMTLAAAVEQMSRAQRRRGLRVVVSDFLTPGDHELDPNVAPDWERAMRRLAVRNQVLAIEVVDRREIEFPNVGDMLIRDPETDFERYVNTGDPDARQRMDAASEEAAPVLSSSASALPTCPAESRRPAK